MKKQKSNKDKKLGEKELSGKIASIKRMENHRKYQLLDSHGNAMFYGIWETGYWWKKLHGLPT